MNFAALLLEGQISVIRGASTMDEAKVKAGEILKEFCQRDLTDEEKELLEDDGYVAYCGHHDATIQIGTIQ